MGVFLPPLGGLGSGLSLGMPNTAVRINFSYFLDRKSVIDQIGKMKAKALRKAGYAVMGSARKSIRKMGMARPKLAVMKSNPRMTLGELIRSPSVPERSKKRLMERLFEIQTKPPSMAGTPPHTHKGVMRRDIVFAWDQTSQSVVIGSFMQGGAWLASLHEFGGMQTMQGWAFVPRYPRSYTRGIIAYWRIGTAPRNKQRWEPTKFRETFNYPARPYMRPAMTRMIASSDVVRSFKNQFKVGGM